MQRNRRIKNGVLIDLTSLLDVIFILLLIVFIGYSNAEMVNKDKLETSIEAAADAEADADARASAYSDMEDTQNNLQQYVWAASIVATYNEEEITNREIKVLVEGAEIESFQLVGNDVSESFLNFKNYLADYIIHHQNQPVILSLNENDDRILYRDEKEIKEIIEELSASYDNVYIKGTIAEV